MASFGTVFQEMCSHGPADKWLTAPTVEQCSLTFFRYVHMKHTAFALEPVDFDCCTGQARFGATNTKYTFTRQGDLVWHTYAKIYLPGIVGAKPAVGTGLEIADGDDAVYWTNAIGQYLLQEVKLAVGSTVIDTLDYMFLFMWEELSGKSGKKLGEMIGKFDTVALRQATSKRSRWLYVPLPFHFTQNTGNALPMVSLQFHSAQLEISFADVKKCVVVPDNTFSVYERPDGEAGAKAVLEAASLSSLKPLGLDSMRCVIEACYVYLDMDERAKFAQGQFEQIIVELQRNHTQATSAVNTATEGTAPTKVDVRLQFNHVVMEYIFAVRQVAKSDANQHFDLGGHFDEDSSGLVLDPIIDVTVLFNNAQRVQTRPGSFFRLVQNYQHHTNVPREFIYVWSYAIDPEDTQPTGGAPHGRIDNVNLRLSVDTRVFKNGSILEVFIFARNYNMLRYKFGCIAKKMG